MVSAVLLLACSSKTETTIVSAKSQTMIAMKTAVNQKDADQYVKRSRDDVEIYLGPRLRIQGKQVLRENRAKHFLKHPNIKSEIQHLVAIDDKIVMHDNVWLHDNKEGKNIVEIFSFENNEIIRVDVIQPKDLFN